MKNETRHIGEFVVTRTRIIGTQFVVYDAYEPAGVFGPHGTTTTIDDRRYGAIPSRRNDPAYRDLPAGSQERIDAVLATFARHYAEAYDLIIAAFPETAKGARIDGAIEIDLERR